MNDMEKMMQVFESLEEFETQVIKTNKEMLLPCICMLVDLQAKLFDQSTPQILSLIGAAADQVNEQMGDSGVLPASMFKN